MEGITAKIGLAVAGLWLSSQEWRLRGKVDKERFSDLQAQTNRIESHQWDIMKELKIQPSMDVPEEIKNNGKD